MKLFERHALLLAGVASTQEYSVKQWRTPSALFVAILKIQNAVSLQQNLKNVNLFDVKLMVDLFTGFWL